MSIFKKKTNECIDHNVEKNNLTSLAMRSEQINFLLFFLCKLFCVGLLGIPGYSYSPLLLLLWFDFFYQKP